MYLQFMFGDIFKFKVKCHLENILCLKYKIIAGKM